ncbi:hypothetical protein A3654_09720 [Corynebacterium glutamicum]|nr:hypothetical protein A3654_09720 [Corynebacterium glutamicum]
MREGGIYMAGVGPPPKDPARLSRASNRKKRQDSQKVIQINPTDQPALPTFYVTETDEEGNQKKRRFVWPAATKRWWEMWAQSPLARDFTDNDWSELLDTALVHARHWSGDTKAAAELRIRAAKFGATPENRARLKIVFAQADEAETRRRSSTAGADRRGPYEGLKAVD